MSLSEIAEQPSISDQLKALGHPVRLKLIGYLASHKNSCCGEMCACFSHSQSTISQHISILKKAGLIDFKKDGTRSCYSLDTNALKSLGEALTSIADAERPQNG